MPSIENWMTNPLQKIQTIFENRTSENCWMKEVEKYFCEKIPNVASLKAVSSLNRTLVHNIHSGCLVHFRCIVQETFEPECYLETFEVVEKSSEQKMILSSAYKDVIEFPDDYTFLETDRNRTGCRQVLYCVCIPAETVWVKEKYNSLGPMSRDCSATSSSGVKRSLDEDNDVSMQLDSSMSEEQTESKRQKASNSKVNGESKPPLKKNHPLPGEDGPVCIVKIYDEDVELKINEMYEFVGVLSVDPSCTVVSDTEEMDAESLEEERAHNPPFSFVPRLHCVRMFKLEHNNPLLNFNMNSSKDISRHNLKQELVSFLKRATFGDELAAEYLLMHLTSRVYARTPGMTVGKFSLNFSNIPPNTKYPSLLSKLLEELTTKTFYFPMTIDNMNKMRFIPSKNYSSNRLESGILQLAEGTHLIIDETELKPGMLDENGVKNMKALTFLMNFQRVEYDFHYHPLSFDQDVPVLVFSEGKSILGCDCQVQLKPETPQPSSLEDYFQSLQVSMDLIDKFRCFLTLSRLGEYQLKEDIMKIVEDDFVASRQMSGEKMTAEDLHKNLVIARLLSLSSGLESLTEDIWKNVGKLEFERRARLT